MGNSSYSQPKDSAPAGFGRDYGEGRVPLSMLKGNLSKEVLAYLHKECEFLTCSETNLSSNPSFQKCIDYPHLPKHVYYEGYFHGETSSLPVKSVNPRYGNLMKKQAAPRALRALYECVRRKITPSLLKALKEEKTKTVVDSEKNIKLTSKKKKKNLLLDTIIDYVEKGTTFSDLAVQVHAGDAVKEHDIGWHTDAPNSLLHMAVSLGSGKRALHTKRSQQGGSAISNNPCESYCDWQSTGDVYISSPACMEHGVQYDQSCFWSNRIIAVQARFPIKEECLHQNASHLSVIASQSDGHHYIDLLSRIEKGLNGCQFEMPSLEELQSVEKELEAIEMRELSSNRSIPDNQASESMTKSQEAAPISEKKDTSKSSSSSSSSSSLPPPSIPPVVLNKQEEAELAKLDTSPSPRFHVDNPELLTYLDTHGYVVVNLQVEPSELDEIKSNLWDFIEKYFQGWKRGEPDTWDEAQVPRHVWGADKGIIYGGGIGQSEFLWRLRTLKGVKETFSKVWGDDDLITSFDGGNIFRPWTTNEEGGKSNRASRKTNGGWWHVDQGRKKSGMKCAVQGFVSLFGADASTGGLCVMPKSQHRHAEVVGSPLQAHNNNDFVTIDPEALLSDFDSLERKLVCCQAGDLVLWDSRTIHCNTPAPKPNFGQQNPNELLRAVGYVCMTPRSFATRDVLEMRRDGYTYGVTTSHWPHEYNSGSSGDPEVELDYEKCPENRKTLIG